MNVRWIGSLSLILCWTTLALTLWENRDASAERQFDAVQIMERVRMNRPAADISLKGRLHVSRGNIILLDVLVKNLPAETRTIYRSPASELLVIQSSHAGVQFYLKARGGITGASRLETFLRSNFTYYDLGAPFVYWPSPRFVGEERSRGRDCYLLESSATNEPYARVKMWIDQEYFGLLRAEAFDADDRLVGRFSVTSFRKIDDVWVPQGIEMARIPRGQSIPSQEKSRLEIYEGNYDANLPLEWFLPEKFEVKDNGS